MRDASRTGRVLGAVIACLAGCASPPPPAAPSTPNAPARSYLVVTSVVVAPGLTNEAWADVYLVQPDGRLVPAGARQALPRVSRLWASFLDAPDGLLHYLHTGPTGTEMWTYQVAPETGILTRLATTPLPRPIGNAGFHPSGRFLYGATTDQQVAGFEIDTRSGVILRPLPGSPWRWQARHRYGLSRMEFSPSGRFLYAHASLIYKTQGLITFRVDASTGALAQTGELSVYDRDSNLGIDARERFAFLVEGIVGEPVRSWRGFAIDGNDGSLHDLSDHPPRRGFVSLLSASSSGRWMFAGGEDSTGIESLRLTAQGELTAAGRLEGPDGEGVLFLQQEGAHVYGFSEKAGVSARFDEETGAFTKLQDLARPAHERVSFVALGRPAS